MKKTMKKISCGVLASVCAFGCAATMTACETSHPEVEMQITFQNKTYTLEYKLYRKIAPETVKHFMWLADNGYYNGLSVHDYDPAQRMYTGAYSVDKSDATDLVYKKYYEVVKGYQDAPISVWADAEKKNPLYTVKGEFSDNHFEVTNGALQESFGSLTMYYHSIANDSVAETDVWSIRASEEGKVSKNDYQYNHATSMFFISLTTTTKTNNGYCTFATLDEDSEDDLESLQDAINDYIDEYYSDDEDAFVQEVTKNVFEDDEFLEGYSVTESYSVPKEPITIKSVKVTKY